VFWAAFRLGIAREVAGRTLWLGALIAAPAWQVLQVAGGYLVAHQLARSSSTVHGAEITLARSQGIDHRG
jgi:uncharacterized BrkB/YihY/UPF0761 family membrane protein